MESICPFLTWQEQASEGLLIIGDSLTTPGISADTIATIYPNLTWTGNIATPGGNSVCGYGGYSAYLYVDIEEVPFRPAGSFDMGPYMLANGYPDVVVISLGINYLFGAADGAQLATFLTNETGYLDQMITEIRAEAGAGTKILITAPGESNTSTSAWEDDYDPPQDSRERWEGYRETIVSTWQAYYGGREDELIWFLAFTFDGDTDYTTSALHLSNSGYVKMGTQLAEKLAELFY